MFFRYALKIENALSRQKVTIDLSIWLAIKNDNLENARILIRNKA